MKKITYLIVFALIVLSPQLFAKGKKVAPVVEPFFSGSYGKFKFENSYKGRYSAVGIGARAGLLLGPLFLAGEIHGQLPAFAKESGTTQSQTDLDPVPSAKQWLSYSAAGGIRTRYFSLIYTYIISSELEAKIRSTDVPANDSDGEETHKYTYFGTGQKLSAMIHFTENFSIGAAYSKYRFNKYTLDEDTHVVDKGSKQGRSALDLEDYSILINYKIKVKVK